MKFTKKIERVGLKVVDGKRISFSDCLRLLEHKNLSEIFFLANFIREKKYGFFTTFSVNRHINYSNICKNKCLFCAFRKEENSKNAKRLSIDSILKIIDEIKHYPNLEIHITGGLDPKFSFEDALMLVRKIKEIKRETIIKAFTMVEIDHFSKTSGLSDLEVIRRLREAGISAFPGGGAEIFSQRIRKKICPLKISGKRWLELSKKAHKLGIPTNATMLYGIGETTEEIAQHLFELRSLQDETNGFMSFIPLLFQKENTPLKGLKNVTILEQLKIYAVSRIFLDNFPHIKNHWAMAGLESAELSQWCGVDDLEGTVFEERIAHESGAQTPVGINKEGIIKIIKAAQRIPVERDGLYRRV